MNTEQQIKKFINSLPEAKQAEMLELHGLMLKIAPDYKLWFDSGVDSQGKTITNPTIGYGLLTITS